MVISPCPYAIVTNSMCSSYLGYIEDPMWFSSRSRSLRVGYEVSRDGESRSKDRLLSRYSDSAVADFPNRAHGASEEGTHRRYLSNGEPFSFSTLSNESKANLIVSHCPESLVR